MNRNKIRINQGRIVPWQFRLAGTVLVFMLIIAAFLKLPEIFAIMAAILISFLLPILWSSYYILEIDPLRKTISEISWIMGFKKSDQMSYESVENIFINPVKVSQRVSSYSGHVNEFKSREYTAYLKLGNGKKFELITDRNPEDLKKRVEPIATKLGCDIFENYQK